MKRKLGMLLLMAALGALLLASAVAECGDYHPFGPWKIKRAATCHAEGKAFRYCRNCDHWEQKDLPKLPHTPGEWTVILEPTCASHGREETYCTVCGDRVRRTIDALPHTDPAEIKGNLIAQLTAPVRWTQSVKNMIADGATEFVELGPGKVLQGLVAKINPAVTVSGMQ